MTEGIEVLHEDDHLVVVNKPPGLVVHPGAGHPSRTLVDILLDLFPAMAPIGEKGRPGVVHRLDKGTSGAMVLAKSHKAYRSLVSLFSRQQITKKYQCLARGKIKAPEGILEAPIGRHPTRRQKMAINRIKGKEAQTRYSVALERAPFFLLNIWPKSGRTHQIRVHLSSLLKAPIVNDWTYGNPTQDKMLLNPKIREIIGDYPHPLLHARALELTHPITGKNIQVKAPVPTLFQRVIDSL